MNFDQIMTELKKRQYRSVYFLMGEEPYFIDVISDYIAENVLAEQERAFNQVVMYGKDTNVYSVVDAAKRFPMMAQQQVIIVKEAQTLKEIDKLQFYIEKPLQSTILVICHKYKSVAKNTKLYKALDNSANVAVLDSKKMYDNQVPAWIDGYLKERGYTIVPAAATLLTEYLGTELSKVANELNKLIILPIPDKKITLEIIEKNIGISKDYNVFEFQKALGAKDILKANRIVDYFARNPNSNPMVLVISSLYSYFVKILTYHYLPDKSQSAVASALKVPPFFVKDYEAAARKYSAPKIIQIISILREYDLKSKGIGNNSTSTSDGDLMKEMTYKILH